jgi:hypothetical protein
MFVAALFCIVFSLAAALGIRHGHVTGVLAYLLGTLPAIPVVGTLVATGAYLSEEKDEFQRNLYIQAILAGVAATLAVTTAWGYLEDFVQAPHLRLALVYPMFWIFVLAAFPVVWLRYRG